MSKNKFSELDKLHNFIFLKYTLNLLFVLYTKINP